MAKGNLQVHQRAPVPMSGFLWGVPTSSFQIEGAAHIEPEFGVAGDIVPHFADRLVESSFRTQFESKGRCESYLRSIPTSIIVRPDASFIGLKAFCERNRAVTVVSAVGRRR
jgi:Glucokinase